MDLHTASHARQQRGLQVRLQTPYLVFPALTSVQERWILALHIGPFLTGLCARYAYTTAIAHSRHYFRFPRACRNEASVPASCSTPSHVPNLLRPPSLVLTRLYTIYPSIGCRATTRTSSRIHLQVALFGFYARRNTFIYVDGTRVVGWLFASRTDHVFAYPVRSRTSTNIGTYTDSHPRRDFLHLRRVIRPVPNEPGMGEL